MKLAIFTLVLDGEPWIKKHLPIFEQLKTSWQWIVVEGAAGNTADTSWCAKQTPRLSTDGTHEYLKSITDPRVTHIYSKHWPNKTVMVNVALAQIKHSCVLMEIDSDEIWNPHQLDQILRLFDERPAVTSMKFACRYFVGPNLITEGQHCFGDNDYEWLRAWRFALGMKFLQHEPPVLDGVVGERILKDESRKLVGTFDHFPYATEAQVKFKERFYKYDGLVEQWRKLQEYDKFPVQLSRFFPFVDDRVMVVRA